MYMFLKMYRVFHMVSVTSVTRNIEVQMFTNRKNRKISAPEDRALNTASIHKKKKM